MTGQERAAMVQKFAEQFVEHADANFQGLSNEKLTCAMLGTISGALAVMAASGLPWPNISGVVNDIITEMSS